MTDQIILYSAPGACSRVPTICLEEIGVPFESKVVRFMKGEHKSREYKKRNSKGKIPALEIDGEFLCENVAIVDYLCERFPEAHLLPPANSVLERANRIADLCFCASTLHPLVTRIRMPHFFAGGEHAKAVWAAGCEAMKEYFSLIEDRMDKQAWWYGGEWSAMDAYLYWVYWRVDGAGFATADYPNFSDHAQRSEARPAVQRAVARETVMTQQLEDEGLNFTPPPID